LDPGTHIATFSLIIYCVNLYDVLESGQSLVNSAVQHEK
jgi:hypothetical protein